MQLHYKKIAFIGLGSNIDNPKKQVTNAIDIISSHSDITLLKKSSLYLTKAYGLIAQNDFINAVIKIETFLDSNSLLDILNQIEKQLKRSRVIKWGPRTIDLDILDFDDQIINTEKLTLPHYDLKNRLFVLQPWAEIEPNWCLSTGEKIIDLLHHLAGSPSL
jgi:2-amino-4-hydroxy-6-hydroxymethyldihydropteridine diphosphokinase